MSLNLTLVTESGSITTTTVQRSDTLSALASAVSRAFGIPPDQQQFMYDGNPLALNVTFASAGVSDGDLLVVNRRSTLPDTVAGGNIVSHGNDRSQQQPMQQPVSAQQREEAERALMGFLRSVNSGFGSSGQMNRPGQGRATGTAGPIARNPNFLDPLSTEGQQAIAEQIRQEAINQNMEAALEHNPEAFGRVVMLFIDCKINAASNVKAFIDRYADLYLHSC